MRPRDDSVPRHRRSTRILGPGSRQSVGRGHRHLLCRRAPAASAVAVLVLGVGVTTGVVVASGSGTEPAVDRTAPAGVLPAPVDLERRPLLRRAGSRQGPVGVPGASSVPATLPARGPVVRAAAMLRAWDEQRAAAWAEADADALRDLYVDGAGAVDVRLLRRYTDRGYRVEGMTTQLLAVDVLERTTVRWRLRVTDRLASAFAVRGRERLRLPRDRADAHVIALVRGADGRWRVAEARPA